MRNRVSPYPSVILSAIVLWVPLSGGCGAGGAAPALGGGGEEAPKRGGEAWGADLARDDAIDLSALDRGDVPEVALAVIRLLRRQDLAGLAGLSVEREGRLFEEMAARGEDHPRHKTYFAGWRWEALEAWDGEVGEIRYWRVGETARAEARFGGGPGFVHVVVLIRVEEEWTFVGISRSSIAAFRSGSVDLPAARKLVVQPALIQAALKGDLDEVRSLLAAGADPNGRDDQGWTPLHAAAQEGRGPVADLLISNGADVSARGPGGNTPLYMAAQHDRPKLASLLLAKGADVDERDADGWTSLIFASQSARMPLIEVLVAEGADVDASAKSGATAMIVAAQNAHDGLVGFLLEAGADPNLGDGRRWTPLHKAAFAGRRAIVDRLLAGGADVDAATEDGWRPLQMAAQEGHALVVEALLAGGAAVNAEVDAGATALDIAEQRGHSDLVKILERHGGKSAR